MKLTQEQETKLIETLQKEAQRPYEKPIARHSEWNGDGSGNVFLIENSRVHGVYEGSPEFEKKLEQAGVEIRWSRW